MSLQLSTVFFLDLAKQKNMKIYIYICMGVSENGGTPKSSTLYNRDFHYKSSILGYPYFWKHPYLTTTEKNMPFFGAFLGATSYTTWIQLRDPGACAEVENVMKLQQWIFLNINYCEL